MSDSDARLFELFDQHCKDSMGHELSPEFWELRGHRVTSPVEPCDQCGQKVFLFLARGWEQPRWLTLGELRDADTLFPYATTRFHRCGDGASWSVEAALFVEAAMREWATTGAAR